MAELAKVIPEETHEMRPEKLFIDESMPQKIKDMLKKAQSYENDLEKEKETNVKIELCEAALVEYVQAFVLVSDSAKSHRRHKEASQQAKYEKQEKNISGRMKYLENLRKQLKNKIRQVTA